MKPWALREANEQDLPQISALGLAVNLQHRAHWPQLFRDGSAAMEQARYWTECLHASGAICLVAEQEDNFAGMLIGRVHTEPRGPLLEACRIFRVSTLAVPAAHQRQGIGRALMLEGMRRATLAGAHELRLNVWHFNTAARALYESLGLHTRLHTLAMSLPANIDKGHAT